MVDNVTNKLKLGAAGTGDPDPNLGALRSYLSLGQSLMPAREKPDPWLTAFQFFTNMAAEASKPGATAIGAAGAAGSNVVKTLLEERKQKRAEDIAGIGLGVKLASTLAKPKTFKQYPTGSTASYMKEEDAKAFLINKGLSASSPNFAAVLKKITAPTDSMVGKPVVFADSFQMMTPVVKGNEIIDFNFTPVTGGSKPANVEYRQKRLPILAKNQDYITKSVEVIPQVDRAMDLLITGNVETGGLSDLTLPLRNVLGQVFGQTDPQVQSQQIIQSISNVLAPKMRPTGSGSTSDMEFDAYRSAIATLKNTPKANYLSLYTFKKVQSNSAKAAQKELEILTSGGNAKDVRKALDKMDKGIYEKYTGSMDDEEQFKGWVADLPKGAVIYNRASGGGKLFTDTDEIFVIKGWGT